MPDNWITFYAKLSQGDESAMAQLFERYSRQLVQLAGENIHPALQKRFDGEDVVQSVFRTFFRRQQAGKFKIERAQQLWQLLVTITIFKTRSASRRHIAAKRNAKAEQLLPNDFEFADHDASIEDVAALLEELENVMKGVPELTGDIVASRLEGKSKTQIANELGVSRQTIHRLLKLVEQRLSSRFDHFSNTETGENANFQKNM